MSEFIAERLGVDAVEFLASAVDIEQPVDAGSFGVASALPARHLTAQGVAVGKAPVQTLFVQHSDLWCGR